MFAVRVRLVRSSLGPASTCIEDPRVRTSSVASRSARSERSYRVRHRRLESWTSSQERRGLCQAPDTTSASRAQKVEDGTSSLFARKHTARKLEGLPFRAAIGDRQAVYWWLLGHELSFQAKSLGSRPRASNRWADAASPSGWRWRGSYPGWLAPGTCVLQSRSHACYSKQPRR
jgi:hypothetical protein